MSEIPLGREVSKQEYAAMVEKGEVLADKLPGYMHCHGQVGLLPVAAASAIIGISAAAAGAIIGISAASAIISISAAADVSH